LMGVRVTKRHHELTSTLSELAAVVVDGDNVDATAERVVLLAMDTIECEFGGLLVQRPKGRLESMAVSAPVVAQADLLQHELREGPCVAASWDDDIYWSRDIGRDARWPNWGPKVAALGFGGLLAVRMGSDKGSVGLLNLYSSRVRQFSHEERAFAHLFASQAASALLAANQIATLRQAVDSRTLIGQAQGILMERYQLDAEQAFAVLRRYSQTHNVKLRAVAEELVESRELRTPELDS
jgi:GAF domain-containing protein